MWRSTQPPDVSSQGPGFTPINAKSNISAVSQDEQETNRESEPPLVPSIHQGNYIRSTETRVPLESQTASTKSAMPQDQNMPKQPKPRGRPKGSKTIKTLEERRARKALKNFEVLKASAKPVAPVAPMIREIIPPRSPAAPEAQNTPNSSVMLPAQRTEDASILPEPIANAQAMPSASEIPLSPTSPSKPSLQQTRQSSDIHEDEATHVDDRNNFQNPPLFVEANDAAEQEGPEELPATLTVDVQKNNPQDDHGSNGSQILGNDPESVQSEHDEDELPDGIFEVEDIRGHKYEQGVLTLHVKWKGYPESDNTWEPEKNLVESAAESLKNYFEAIGGRPEPKANVGRPRKRPNRTRVLPREKSDEYRVPTPSSNTSEPWSPMPPEEGNWEEHVLKISHLCKVGDQILAGVIWVTEDFQGNRYQTQQEYWAVRLAAPKALLKYFEGSIAFEDTAELGIPTTARFRPEEETDYVVRTNLANESRTRKRGSQDSRSPGILPTRPKKAKG